MPGFFIRAHSVLDPNVKQVTHRKASTTFIFCWRCGKAKVCAIQTPALAAAPPTATISQHKFCQPADVLQHLSWQLRAWLGCQPSKNQQPSPLKASLSSRFETQQSDSWQYVVGWRAEIRIGNPKNCIVCLLAIKVLQHPANNIEGGLAQHHEMVAQLSPSASIVEPPCRCICLAP